MYKKAQRLMGKPSASPAVPLLRPTRGEQPRLTNLGCHPRASVHADDMDDIEIILRVFDAEEEYGPCSRIRCALLFASPCTPSPRPLAPRVC